MIDKLSESSIVSAVAKEAAERVARRVIAALQRMEQTLSGDDSGLKTTWDEICVQVQYEQSFYWDAYDETVRGIVKGYITELRRYETEAIWLQTNEGSDWMSDDEEGRVGRLWPVRKIMPHGNPKRERGRKRGNPCKRSPSLTRRVTLRPPTNNDAIQAAEKFRDIGDEMCGKCVPPLRPLCFLEFVAHSPPPIAELCSAEEFTG